MASDSTKKRVLVINVKIQTLADITKGHTMIKAVAAWVENGENGCK